MHPSLVLRVMLGHALLSLLRVSVTVIGAGTLSRASSSYSSSASFNGGQVTDDGTHEEIHPGDHFQLGHHQSDGYVSEWNKDWFPMVGGRANQGKCINIPDNMTLCRGIGYDKMRLPNLLEHDSVKEAIQQATSWVPLMNVRCHQDTQVFLCSLFAPVCLDRPIWPCRTLCEAVKDGCESRMRKYGFPWPAMLKCDQFPAENELCIGIRQENQSDESSCPACVQPETFEIVVDNFCSADYGMKIRLQDAVVTGSDLKLVASKKKKVFKRGALTSRELREATFYIENGAQCKCRIAEELKSNPKNAGSFLIMGNRKNDRLVLSFIEKIEKKSADMTKALDAIRRGKICKAGIQMITSDDAKKTDGKAKNDQTKNNKSDTKKKDTKNEKQEDAKKRTEEKDDGQKRDKKKNGKKEDEATNNRNKPDDIKRNTKTDEAKKGSQKGERRKTKDGKRVTTSNEQSNVYNAEKRNKERETKLVQKVQV